MINQNSPSSHGYLLFQQFQTMFDSMVAQPCLILNLIFTFQSFSLKLCLQLLIQKFDVRLHSPTFVTKAVKV